MKSIRVLLSLIVAVAVLFASTVSINAIGFEAEKVYESVVVIYSGTAMGSGFAIGENWIVTNAHVIENPRHIEVVTYGGEKYKASVVGMDKEQDIAVLLVEEAWFPWLEIGDVGSLMTGDDIYAIGAPKGMAYTLTKGGISAKERIIRGQSYIQIDAAINEGNSGGPLLNDAGQVIGMNTLKMSDSEGIGLAIPISRIGKYLETLGIEVGTELIVDNSEEQSEDENISYADTESVQDDNEQTNVEEQPNSTALTYITISVAGVSMVVNVVLVITLHAERKKGQKTFYDPRERTDFEIDILE